MTRVGSQRHSKKRGNLDPSSSVVPRGGKRNWYSPFGSRNICYLVSIMTTLKDVFHVNRGHLVDFRKIMYP